MNIRLPNPPMEGAYFYACQHENRVSLGRSRHWCRDCGALRVPNTDARVHRQIKHHAVGNTGDGFVWVCPIRDGWPDELAEHMQRALS